MSIEFDKWKLTLPTGKPDEIKKDIEKYKDENFYKTDEGYVFTARCDGKTTPNSKYPRCELRETTPKEWVCGTGTHEMVYSFTVLDCPKNKPQVVIGQIHDDKDEVVFIRFKKNECIEAESFKKKYFLHGAELNKRYFIKISSIEKNLIIECYEDKDKITKVKIPLQKQYKKSYFKVGCYTQANSSQGEPKDSKGSVLLHSCKVEHSIKVPKRSLTEEITYTTLPSKDDKNVCILI